MASSPAAFARNFAYLQIDLTDPDFREHLSKQRARHPRGAAEAHRRSDRCGRAGAGYQRQAAGAHDRGSDRRLDDELGVLPGRPRREMDAPRPRRHPETLYLIEARDSEARLVVRGGLSRFLHLSCAYARSSARHVADSPAAIAVAAASMSAAEADATRPSRRRSPPTKPGRNRRRPRR